MTEREEPTPEERAEHREMHMQELRDLLDCTHDSEERMREGVRTLIHVRTLQHEEDPEVVIPDEEEVYVALQMLHIAFTAAIIAAETIGNDESGQPTEIVLGQWAGMVMQAHVSANRIRNAIESMFGGMSQN